MSAGAPWSVKGIDPKAREIAKDLARRSGMTLGEWLNQMIMEDGEDDPVVTPLGRRAPPYLGGDRRGRYRRLDDAYDDAPASASTQDADLDHVTRAIEELTRRIESAEARSTLAVSGVDQAVAGLLARLEGAERDQSATSARLEHVTEDLREEQGRALDRLRQLEREANGPRSTEALRALETALGKIANQLYEGETRTRASLAEARQDLTSVLRRVDRIEARSPEAEIVDGVVARVAERLEAAEAMTSSAVRALEGSFAQLDERLRAAEGRLQPDGDREGRLERLADELSSRFDESRAELIRHFDGLADARFDKLETRLQDLGGHVRAAEARSAQAIDRMGHEVLRIAQNLNRRMTGVETTSAQSVERVAQAVEQRMRRSDSAHAQALEKLGADITEISARLTERIVHSERRAAQTAEDVGDRMGRLADKIDGRLDRTSLEFAERIRLSEERTQRLLEEARETVDRGLARAEARAAATPPAEPAWNDPAPAFGHASAAPEHAPTAFDEPAFGSSSGVHAEHAGAPDALFAEPAPFPAFPGAEPGPSNQSFDEVFASVRPLAAAQAEALAPAAFDDFAAETEFLAPDETPAPPRPAVSTKEAIEAARAAARLGVRNSSGDASSGPFGLGKLGGGGKAKLQERVKRESKREGSVVTKAFMASGVAAVIASGLVGSYLLLDRADAEGRNGLTIVPANLFGPGQDAQTPLAAVAIAAQPVMAPSPDQSGAEDIYQRAVDKLTNDEPDAVQLLSKAANLGHTSAQLLLADFYAKGQHNVAKDPVEARRWTQRAADGGDRRAMFNLAMFMMTGDGGPKDQATAVKWFRKAADRGLGDAQFNLAALYEQGIGVPQDAAEALKWYLITARDGDASAKEAAARVRPGLSLSAQRDAERSARAFEARESEPTNLAAR